MFETFRDWEPEGNIKTTFVDGNNVKRLWTCNQPELLSIIERVVKNYQAQEIKLTNRQLYYQLVSLDYIPNAQEVYKRICTFITDARYGGKIDWDAIEDRGRTPSRHPQWDTIEDRVDSAVASYRLPRWKDQEYYVEMFCEKQAMESVLEPIADKYHIYFGCNKGYSSASTLYELSRRMIYACERNDAEPKKAIILYMGDHDSSGLDMVRDMEDRIEEFYHRGIVRGSEFEIVPLALNMEQIKKYNPPPNPAKMTDPRAKKYVDEFGESSWELDALKPEVLMKIAEIGIQKYLDIDKYNEVIKREKKDVLPLQEFAEKTRARRNRHAD
jgi:hypothetical protein